MTHIEQHPHQELTGAINRRSFLRGLGVVAAGTAVTGLLGACGSGSDAGAGGGLLDRLRQRGSIKVGFANEAPYGFRNAKGDLTGEAPEVARAVMSHLGVDKLEGVLVDFGALIPGLRAGNYDMIAAGMAITPDRCEQVLFSDPDYQSRQSLVVKKGNPLGLSDLKSVVDTPQARVAFLQGGLVLQWAKDVGVKDSQITTLSSAQNLLAALQSGRVDAFTLTAPSAHWQVKTSAGSGIEMLDSFIPVVDGTKQDSYGGYGFRKDSEQFRDAFTNQLNKLQQQNRIWPIVKQFGFDKQSVSAAKDKTATKLCRAT